MSNYKKIPVIKNRVVIQEQRKRSFVRITAVGVILAIMLIYVWLKIQTNSYLGKIQLLNKELSRKTVENEKLQGAVGRLSNFGRINKIAQEELGLTFLDNEDIIEISK